MVWSPYSPYADVNSKECWRTSGSMKSSTLFTTGAAGEFRHGNCVLTVLLPMMFWLFIASGSGLEKCWYLCTNWHLVSTAFLQVPDAFSALFLQLLCLHCKKICCSAHISCLTMLPKTSYPKRFSSFPSMRAGLLTLTAQTFVAITLVGPSHFLFFILLSWPALISSELY